MTRRYQDLVAVLVIVLGVAAVDAFSFQDKPEAKKAAGKDGDYAMVGEKLDALFSDEQAMSDPDHKKVRATVDTCLKYLRDKEDKATPEGKTDVLRARIRLLTGVLGNRLVKDDKLLVMLKDTYAQYSQLVADSDDLGEELNSVQQVIAVEASVEEAVSFLQGEAKRAGSIVREHARFYIAEQFVQFMGRASEAEPVLSDLAKSAKSDSVRFLAGQLSGAVRDCSIGKILPSLKLTDLEGSVVTSTTWAGTETLLIAESPGCGGCDGLPQELKNLREVFDSKRLRIVLLVLGEDVAKVKTDLLGADFGKAGITVFPVKWTPGEFLGSDECALKLHITGIPSGWFIGQDGKILQTTLERGTYKDFMKSVLAHLRGK